MRNCLLVMLVAMPGLTTPHEEPRILEKIAPEYTDQAKLARLEGSALVSLVVGEDGTLRDVHVTRPIGLGLDDKAVQAVKQWQFAPAIRDERPVQAVARVEVSFRLLMRREDWHLTRVEFDPSDATPPVIVSAPYPEHDKSADPASAKISFDIDEHGAPANFHVERASDDHAARQVMQFLAQWRFQPAMAGGRPVASRATFEFAAGSGVVSE